MQPNGQLAVDSEKISTFHRVGDKYPSSNDLDLPTDFGVEGSCPSGLRLYNHAKPFDGR